MSRHVQSRRKKSTKTPILVKVVHYREAEKSAGTSDDSSSGLRVRTFFQPVFDPGEDAMTLFEVRGNNGFDTSWV